MFPFDDVIMICHKNAQRNVYKINIYLNNANRFHILATVMLPDNQIISFTITTTNPYQYI